MSSSERRKHGGRREGAGRPAVLKLKEQHTITFALPGPMKKALDVFVRKSKTESRSSIIREALRRFLKL